MKIITLTLPFFILSLVLFKCGFGSVVSRKTEIDASKCVSLSADQVSLSKDFYDKYEGKCIQITGKVGFVGGDNKASASIITGDPKKSFVFQFFDDKQSDLSGLAVGKTATIRGKCCSGGWEANYFTLIPSEVVK